MKRIKTHKIQNTALLFIFIAPFTIAYYASYMFNPTNMGNVWLYVLQLFADIIAITNLGTLWITILLDIMQPEYYKRDLKYDEKWIYQKPIAIDVLIPVSNEPLDIIRQTLQKAIEMEFPHQTFVLDDAGSPMTKNLAKNLGITYIARPKHAKTHAKSGNLNYGLQYSHAPFFAVFDADHIPQKEFIVELLPFFENRKVALVQTPQHYVNTQNFIASGTAQAQEIFYKYVQPAKNSYNAAFCVGTNMLYRRTAIDEVGGIAKRDHSEDVWTTILLHEKGWESVFYNKILAKGRAPESIGSFFRQQNRWARGGFSLFFTHNPLFIDGLSTDQKLQYFFSNLHYFSAFSMFIYLILPILYLLFGIHPMNILHSNDWVIHYVPYFVTVYFLPLFLLGNFNISTASTALASFAPYLKAFFSVVLKNKYTWVATEGKKKQGEIIMTHIWPHVFFIILSLLAIVVGWYNVQDTTTTIIVSFWVLVNSYLLYAFVKNGLFSITT